MEICSPWNWDSGKCHSMEGIGKVWRKRWGSARPYFCVYLKGGSKGSPFFL